MIRLLSDALEGIAWEVVFVDDDSPDGTADEVRAVAKENPRVRVLHRIGRRGLAGACIEGILSSTARFCAVIDGDQQHDETILHQMLDRLRGDDALDIVIGTRIAEGGLTRMRQAGSNVATRLARRLLGISATDPMSGFFMVRRASFNQVVTELQPTGFKILADMLSVVGRRWKVDEVGYRFRARELGESKMDTAITMEYLGLLLSRVTGGLVSIRFILFSFVGLSGVVVQLLVVRLALSVFHDFSYAQALGVFVAMNSNFLLNNVLTYRDRALRGWAVLRGLVSFYAVCSLGAVMNVAVGTMIFNAFPVWSFASFVGAVFGAIWNFVLSAMFTWRAS